MPFSKANLDVHCLCILLLITTYLSHVQTRFVELSVIKLYFNDIVVCQLQNVHNLELFQTAVSFQHNEWLYKKWEFKSVLYNRC